MSKKIGLWIIMRAPLFTIIIQTEGILGKIFKPTLNQVATFSLYIIK